MTSTTSTSLQYIERSLLEGKWTTGESTPNGPALSNAAVQLAQDVVDGKFKEILTNPIYRTFLTITPNHDLFATPSTEPSPDDSTTPTTRRLQSPITSTHLPLLTDSIDLPTREDKELARLVLGIAALHAFLQINWTGPDLDLQISSLLTVDATPSSISEDDLHHHAVLSLSLGGEPAYHLAQKSFLLCLAIMLFGDQLGSSGMNNTPEEPFRTVVKKTVAWWKFRARVVRQRILDEPVASSSEPDLEQEIEDALQTSSEEEEQDLRGRWILEKGLLQHVFAYDKAAATDFVKSAKETSLKFELTGALGKRTKFQQTSITQLVLLAESRKRKDDEGDPEDADPAPTENGSASSSPTTTLNAATHSLPETLALNDDTLLEQTEFTSTLDSSSSNSSSLLSHIDPSSQPALHPLDQCILLALCLNVKNTSPAHGLTSEQMSPYVARVISHPRNWSVHTMSLLLRSRLESNRTRTVERSTLQLQALVEQMPTADSTVSERLMYIHDILLPSKWDMEKELATRYLSLGIVRSALEIFERLEMWEDVVSCWHSLERPEKGIQIVKDLLQGVKEESDVVVNKGKASNQSSTKRSSALIDDIRKAKYWCLLGDLEPSKASEHYTKAWEVSKQTSGRAMRSLGGYHFARGEYTESAKCLKIAVGINPLLTRSWFILGCALVRLEDWSGARDAFVRCVSIDEEDGESWSNLASVYMRMGEVEMKDGDDNGEANTKQTNAVPFDNKMLAFRALKQGLKSSYGNWRMWSNYMIVAMDAGELSEASRALTRIVEEQGEKAGENAVDLEVLERLVDAVTTSAFSDQTNSNEPQERRSTGGLTPRMVRELFTRTLLPRISSSPRIFKAYARLMIAEGNSWRTALEAHMNAHRAYMARDEDKMFSDLDTWKEAIEEVENVVDILRNLGPRAAEEEEKEREGNGVEGRKRITSWQFQARGLVRTFMGRSRGAFGDEPEWKKLEDLLEELKS